MSTGLKFEPDVLSEKDDKLLQVSRKLAAFNLVQRREPNRIVVLIDDDKRFDRFYASLSPEEKQLVTTERGVFIDVEPDASRVIHRKTGSTADGWKY